MTRSIIVNQTLLSKRVTKSAANLLQIQKPDSSLYKITAIKPITIAKHSDIKEHIRRYLTDKIVIDKIKAIYKKLKGKDIKGADENIINYIQYGLLYSFLDKQKNIDMVSVTKKRTTKRGTITSRNKNDVLTNNLSKINKVKKLIDIFFGSDDKYIKHELLTSKKTIYTSEKKSKKNTSLNTFNRSFLTSLSDKDKTSSQNIYEDIKKNSVNDLNFKDFDKVLDVIPEEDTNSSSSKPSDIKPSDIKPLPTSVITKLPLYANLKLRILFSTPRIPKNPKK